MYDIITEEYNLSNTLDSFYSIGDLLTLCKQFPDKFFEFYGTDLTVGDLGSWRGSYDLPAIEPTEGMLKGKEIYDKISKQIKETHYGYKGGEYKYHEGEEFYISEYGISNEHKVVGWQQEGSCIVLLTKLDPY